MTQYTLFDIIGPVMIGPSSSHTAGAVRLGLAARAVVGEPIVKAEMILHGSFATTGKGHGTRLALLAGLLGMAPDDEKIRHAEEIAREKGLQYQFQQQDLGDVHPNTVLFQITTENGTEYSIQGSSVGGGAILVTNINGMEVSFGGEYATIITLQEDKPGVVAGITSVLAVSGVNVATMRLFRSGRGMHAVLVSEVDQMPEKWVIDSITALPNVRMVRLIPALT